MATLQRKKKSIKDGQKLFDQFNRRYFGSRLPRYEIITDGPYYGGRCEPWNHRIYVTVKKSRFVVTLLHEMAHAAVYPNENHGPVWQREMIRLRKLGAPIPELEYKQYENRRATKAQRVIIEILDAILLNPKSPTKDVVRAGRRKYGLTKAELREMACKTLGHFRHLFNGTIPHNIVELHNSI
jgi:hypothetical protein